MSARTFLPDRSLLLHASSVLALGLLALGSLALGSLALGCLGRSPVTHYYTMSAAGNGQGSPSDLAVGLGPVTLPVYLDRPQIVTRTSGSQLQIDEQHRWAGGFESNLTQALALDLAARLGSDRVFLDASASPVPVAFQVAIDVHQFEGQEGGGIVLRARFVVREKSGEGRAWVRESTIRQDVSGGGLQGLIAAHDAALASLADQIAAQIRSAL